MATVTVWTMKIGGSASGSLPAQTNTLAGFGIDRPQCRFRSQDDDEFTFEMKQSATVLPGLGYGEAITLYKTVNGAVTKWFVGTISKITTIGNPKNEVVRYVASGPWYQFKRTMWQVSSQCYAPSVGGAPCVLQGIKMTKVVLFQDPVSGAAITTGQQITNIISYAQTLGIAVAAGILPSFINVPFEETRDLTLADVIRRCLQWTPDGVTWLNYNAGTPTFNAQQRASLSGVTLDINAENLIAGLELTPRYDLVAAGVRFNYVGISSCNIEVPNGCVDPSTGILNTGAEKLSQDPVTVQTISQDNGGQSADQVPGCLIGTVDLQQLTGTTTENPPNGLALQYYTSLLSPFVEGTVTTHEQECSGTLRPGKVLNLTNGQTLWASMNTPIQEVTENLYTGETEAKVGIAKHVSPMTFAYLVNMTARRPLVVSGLSAVNTPGSGGNSCPQGISPETQKLLNKLAGANSSAAQAINNGGNGNSIGRSLPIVTIAVCSGGQLKNQEVYAPQV